jgi:hypothetical protein
MLYRFTDYLIEREIYYYFVGVGYGAHSVNRQISEIAGSDI